LDEEREIPTFSTLATLKTELVYRQSWPTRQQASTAIFEFIEGFYNNRRLHSTLGYRSPANFEFNHWKEVLVA
jgi:transposase InsO family protein